eukprot:358791-Chlamydomonas_euryale.AAC.2
MCDGRGLVRRAGRARARTQCVSLYVQPAFVCVPAVYLSRGKLERAHACTVGPRRPPGGPSGNAGGGRRRGGQRQRTGVAGAAADVRVAAGNRCATSLAIWGRSGEGSTMDGGNMRMQAMEGYQGGRSGEEGRLGDEGSASAYV